MHISRLKNVYDTNPLSYPIDVIHKEIVSGQTSISNCHDDFKYKRLSDYTEYARELRRHKYKSSAYHRVKCSLPQMCPAGILNGRHEVKEFSGLVCLDFDDVNTDYAYLASLAFQHPSVYAFFRSLSNKLKIIFLVDKQGLDANTYKHAYIKASDVFSHIAIADKSSALPTHLQGYCYDSQSYLNTSAIPLSWQVNDELAKSFLGKEYNRSITIGNVDGLDLEYRLAIEDMMFDESGWGNTNVPCTQKRHFNMRFRG